MVTDTETGKMIRVHANCVINATGVWVDDLRRMDEHPESHLITPSQGIHLVVDKDFLPGEHALLVPKTDDGRVMFAIPWLGKVILGTTDTPRDIIESEPTPLPEEVNFILGEAGKYLARKPSAGDVRSIWSGARPLVKTAENSSGNTKDISREHTILVDKSGLVTVTGGKWTTYRAMAEEVLASCIQSGLLAPDSISTTIDLQLIGAPATVAHKLSDPPGSHLYGSEALLLDDLPGYQHELGMGLTEAMVRFAVRFEAARKVEDVLARRHRVLFLDAAVAHELADEVATLITDELGQEPEDVAEFKRLAQRYLSLPG
jgi:glycerol-3-phosphate dehydrogenase